MRLAIFFSLMGISILISLVRPFYGLLTFTWLAYMRPQNLAWAQQDYRFSYYVGIALLIGCCLKAKKEKIFIRARENNLMILLLIMLSVSTFFSTLPAVSLIKLMEMAKIILIAILTGSLVNSKKRFKYLSWIIVFSFGFLAVKGVLRGVLLGWRLQGPAGSMITDNNDFALALNMVLPFFLYLGMNEQIKWRKWLFYFQFPLVIIAIIFTYSRGGFIGLCAVIFFLVLRSRKKLLGFSALVIGLVLFLNFAPQAYKERLETVKTYEEDKSAMGRIYAWEAAWNMVKDRPLTGVGLGKNNFLLAFPSYHQSNPRVAHNSYLQLLAESGFIALGVFLLLIALSIKKLRALRKNYPLNNENSWIHNYSNMLEIGFVGYIVSGMFLSRADFDLMYQFIGMTVALDHIARIQAIDKKKAVKKKGIQRVYA